MDLTEEELLNTIDFDDVNENEYEAINGIGEDDIHIEVGMEFSNKEEIYALYNAYALKKGFGLRKRNARPNYILLTCNRNGYNADVKNTCASEGSQRLSSTMRIGCKAVLSACKEGSSGMWKITKFMDIHNHEMVSPKSVTLLRSHKVYSKAARTLTESFSHVGLPIAKVTQVFGSSSVPFDVQDCYNHMKKIRRIIYEAGDAQAVQVYCTQQHEIDPNFFYSIQFDDESRMMNFCWIDSRSRSAYEQFGDVVTFDTTYRTNKYSMPFAPFVGINHHLQSIMFGCALLHDETEETFTWLFQTWLSAMKGKKPKAIITDQDAAMGNAIANVFPDTRHRLCMWHIMRKFPEKLSYVYHENSKFKRDINDCIYNAKNIQAFEQQWIEVMEKYNLVHHEWLKGLYDIRSSWIPIFNRGTFFAGMTTTQRSESINSFFDGFVHSGMTLREFIVKYDAALDSRYDSYKREEFDSRHRERRLTLNMPIEEHAASIYTRNVWAKFHEQLSSILKLSKEKINKVGQLSSYRVWNKKDLNDDFQVSIDLSILNVTCTCMYFEFIGILCRHILAILHAKNIEEIPLHYILPRWRKDGNHIVRGSKAASIASNYCLRSLDLRHEYGNLDELSNLSSKAHKYIKDALNTIVATASEMITNDNDAIGIGETIVGSNLSTQDSGFILKDPKTSQTKGRKRIKSGIEMSNKNSNICSNCGTRGHNKRSCKQPRKDAGQN